MKARQIGKTYSVRAFAAEQYQNVVYINFKNNRSVRAAFEDGRYDVICTGSLLGVKGYNRKNSRGVPVGSEQIVYMHPMDFEEFLWGRGVDEGVISEMRACAKPWASSPFVDKLPTICQLLACGASS